MKPWPALIARDLARAFAGGGALLPVVFFLLVATLFPFAVGPDGSLLARTGGGALWMAALLAALLPVDRLVVADAEAGVLDQLAVRGLSEEGVAAAKIVAHWLSFGPPLMLATLPAAALLRLEVGTLARLEAGLALGTPERPAEAVALGIVGPAGQGRQRFLARLGGQPLDHHPSPVAGVGVRRLLCPPPVSDRQTFAWGTA